MVGPAVVFSGCVVEPGARVERSILGRGVGRLGRVRW